MSEKKASARSTRFFAPVLSVLALGATLGLSADHLYGSSYFLNSLTSDASATLATSTAETPVPPKPEIVHLSTPAPLRAIYMTQCVVGTPSFRAELVELIDKTELNAVVIDIKDFSGGIAFPPQHSSLVPYHSTRCGAADMKEYIDYLHEKNIYVVGRITVFQDPLYTASHPEHAVKRKDNGEVWRDRKGLAFVDVGARPFWEYIVELSKESYALGFDELNFDYIRYPSDGDMQNASFTLSVGKSKSAMLEEFFSYLHKHLSTIGAVLSADLFGYTTVHQDDLGIGQILERALPYFDYIYPMVYPSHYNDGFAGIPDPNSDPYTVVYTSLSEALLREAATTTLQTSFVYTPIASTTPQQYEKPAYKGKIVPWLQSFDYPVHYSPQMVQAQIQATYESGIDSWIFWDPANRYSSLRQVLSEVGYTE